MPIERQHDGEPLRVSLPQDLPPADLSGEKIEELLRQKREGPNQIGQDPVYLSAFLSMNSVIGQTGRLVFRFRTVDSILNDYRGWIVDSIVVAEEAAFAGLGFRYFGLR